MRTAKNLIGGIGFYLVLFGPNFIFFDVFIAISLLFSFISIYLFSSEALSIPKVLFQFLGLLVLTIFYTLMIAVCWNFKDMILIGDFFKMFIYVFAALFIVKLFGRANTEKRLNISIYYATVINAAIVLLTFIVPGVKERILPLLSFKLASSWEVISGIRGTDWSMGGGTALSIIFVMVFILGQTYKNEIKLWFECNIILFCACFLSGRTGFYMMVALGFFFAAKALYKQITSTQASAIRRSNLIRLGIYPLFLIFIFIKASDFIDLQLLTERVLPWAFETFYQYADGGKLESGTTSILFNDFYFLPPTLMETIFGSLNFVENSDVGYIKVIHYCGIIGLILVIVPFFILWKLGRRTYQISASGKFLIFYLILIFIINFKELYLANSRTGFLLLMLWLVLAAEKLKYIRETASAGQSSLL